VTAAPDVAYVFGAAGEAAYLWRRTGTTWKKISPLPALNINQAWYDWYVAASPTTRHESISAQSTRSVEASPAPVGHGKTSARRVPTAYIRISTA
jgi:hypothetical protein